MRPTERQSTDHRTLQPALLALAIASCFAIQPVYALPGGAQVVAGAANLSRSGNTLTVANTPGTIINWSNFSVGALETVRFQQQSALSSVLNRVTGADASAIHGALSSNGRVWLINPNGILFGAGSRVDIPGFVASTLNVSDSDFRAGKLNFNAGAVAGSIRNDGVISNTGSGNIYLVAPDITNTGLITAPTGEVLLAAGRQVSLVDNAHPDVQIVVSAPTDQAVNLGQIATQNGRVSLFGALLSQKGRISADKVDVDDAGRIVFRGSQVTLDTGSTTTANGGHVTVQSSGDTYVKGDVSATSSTGTGGTIEVLGHRVAVMDHATLDASGETGGGRILVGGDYQGKNPAIQNSQVTYFGPDATLKTDAQKVGAGGTAVVWADDTTRAYGSISARGGRQDGDGGFVEVSGKGTLDFQASVDTRAPNGNTGQLLLDPTNIFIAASLANANAAGMGPGNDPAVNSSGPSIFQSGGISTDPTDSYLLTGTLQAALGNNAVTVTTTSGRLGAGNIKLVDPVSWASANNLTLTADAVISLGAPLTGGAATIILDGKGITQSAGAIITANKLKINSVASSSPVILSEANRVNVLAADMSFSAGGGLTYSNAQSLTIDTVGGTNGIVFSNNGNPITITTSVGNLTLNQGVVSDAMGGSQITLGAANTLTLNAAVTSTSNSSPVGPVILTAGAGGVTSNASGVITTAGLKVISGGSVTLNAANIVSTLAGTSNGSFQFAGDTVNGFDVGTVSGTNGLAASTGDIILKSGFLDGQIGISQPVTATAGNVSITADHINVGFPINATAAGKLIEIKPLTATTSPNFRNGADAPGELALSSGEIGNLNTPMLKFGNSVVSGPILIQYPITGTTFTSLSLITGGDISQTTGNAITIQNLNADGANVFLDQAANSVSNLGGRASGGSFLFTNGANSLNVALVDVNNGIQATGSISLTSGGAISQSNGAIISAPASGLFISSGSGTTLNQNNMVSFVNITNSTNGDISFKANTSALSAWASNAGAGNITINNIGGTLGLNSISTGSGNIVLTGSGNVTSANSTAANTTGPVIVTSTTGAIDNGDGMTLTGSTITLNAATGIGPTSAVYINATTKVNAQTTNGNIALSGSPDLLLGLISAPGTVNLSSSGGAITDANGAANNISGASATLSAYSGIGSADAIETNVNSLSASGGISGNIAIANAKAMSANAQSPSGSVTLSAAGPLTINAATTAANAITLTAGGPTWVPGKTGDDLTISAALTLAAMGTITLNAGNAIMGSNIPVTGGSTTVVLNPNLNPPLAPQGTTYSVDTLLTSGVATHTYGQASNAVFGYSLAGGALADDVISGSAAFTPTIGRLTPAGTFDVKYESGLFSSLSSSFVPGKGLSYTINPALLNLSLTNVIALNKIYDGNKAAKFSGGALQGVIDNDQVVATLQGDFSDRHVGTAKPVTLTGASLGGSAASNYVLAPVATTGSYSADITPLAAVSWIGGSGSWSDPLHWTGGALPDRNNVLNVSIPAGVSVTYDSDTTTLQNLSSGGQFFMTSGELSIGQSFSTSQYSQSGGTLSGAGSFTVSDAFNKTGGLFTMSGPLSVYHSRGDLLFTHDSPARIVLLRAPTGKVTAINKGATLITEGGVQAGSDIRIVANSPLTIDAPLVGGGSVDLTASYPGQLTLTPSASFSAPGGITLTGTGGIVGSIPSGATANDNSNQAPLPPGSTQQQLNCLLNPTTCNTAPSTASQQIINSLVSQASIHQQQVIENISPESIKPVQLLAGTGGGSGSPPNDPDNPRRSQQGSTGGTGSNQASTTNTQHQYCN